VADDAENNGPKSPANGEPPPTPSEPPPSDTKPKPGAKPRARWTVVVAALSALLVSLLLLLGDALAGILNNLGGPPSAGTYIGIAMVGYGALALASVFLFGLGLANAARRRAATIAAWTIIPVAIGWFILLGRLTAG